MSWERAHIGVICPPVPPGLGKISCMQSFSCPYICSSVFPYPTVQTAVGWFQGLLTVFMHLTDVLPPSRGCDETPAAHLHTGDEGQHDLV